MAGNYGPWLGKKVREPVTECAGYYSKDGLVRRD